MQLESPIALPDGLNLIANAHGRAFLQIDHPAVTAQISLEGAHITQCQPAGQPPLLWLSPEEPGLPGKSMRGGIPVCWPWFGDSPRGPAHGIARTSKWTLESAHTDSSQVRVSMRLDAATIAEKLPGEQWQVEIEFVLGENLLVTLTSRNLGSSVQTLSQALHSYLPVTDIDAVSIQGLDNCAYVNQLTGLQQTQNGPLGIDKETDRIYFDHSGDVTVKAPGQGDLIVSREGSQSLVLWNPWIEKSLRLNHLAPTGYQGMLCIEAANAGPDTREIQPGESHSLSTRIRRR